MSPGLPAVEVEPAKLALTPVRLLVATVDQANKVPSPALRFITLAVEAEPVGHRPKTKDLEVLEAVVAQAMTSIPAQRDRQILGAAEEVALLLTRPRPHQEE